MEYSITIHEILKPSANYSPEIDLLRSMWKKQIASDFYFHFGEYKKAFQLYKCASEIFQSILNSPTIDQQYKPEETKRLLVDVCNNMALCQMKLNDFPKAKQSCQDALQHDPKNIKALCRIAKCCIVLGQYDEAESSLDEAKSFQKISTTSNGTESGTIGDSGSIDSINHISNLLRHSKAHYKVKEKAMYKKMGKGIAVRKQTQHNDTTPPLGNQTAALGNPSTVMHDSVQNSSTTTKITGFQNYPRIVFIFSSVLVFIAAVLLQYFLRGKL
jgi:tetratricopeptide (TPR) repeat protein